MGKIGNEVVARFRDGKVIKGYTFDFKSDKESKRNIHGEKSESSDKPADSKKDSKQDKKPGKEAAGSGKKESSSPGKSGGKGSSSAVA